MDNNSLFLKSSMFGGFKKKEVLSYIFELNESTQEAQQRFAEQIDELSCSRDELLNATEEMQARYESLQADLDEMVMKLEAETDKNLKSAETIERLTEELKRRDGDVTRKESEIARFTAMNTELADKNRVLEEKRSQVELAASQIAGILGQARRDANKVVDEAREEAAKIILKAQNKADVLAAHAKDLAERHTEDANRRTESAYRQFGEFRSELDRLCQVVLGAASEITEKAGAIGNVATKVTEIVPKKLEPPVSTLDNLTAPAILKYEVEEGSDSHPGPAQGDAEVSGLAGEILGRYGVRKDDSGFFRLAIEK